MCMLASIRVKPEVNNPPFFLKRIEFYYQHSIVISTTNPGQVFIVDTALFVNNHLDYTPDCCFKKCLYPAILFTDSGVYKCKPKTFGPVG